MMLGLIISATSTPAGANPAWHVALSGNVGSRENVLQSVSCFSPNSCQAVGYYEGDGGEKQALVASWNGTVWSVTGVAPLGTLSNVLDSVSCASATSCQAVGTYQVRVGDNRIEQTLVASWNGAASPPSWTAAAGPNVENIRTRANVLQSVSCFSPNSCQAVGFYVNRVNDRRVNQTLVASWNGTVWTAAAGPIVLNAGPNVPNDLRVVPNALRAVSCPSATLCEAVGTANLSNGSPGVTIQTLVASWNGAASPPTWTAAAGPNVLNGGIRRANSLNSVSCASATSCQAVGDYSPAGEVQTLVASWNGAASPPTWTASAGPNVLYGGERVRNILNGVSCAEATSCQAVGNYDNGKGAIGSVTASWDGTGWTASAGPNLLDSDGMMFRNILNGVSCVSPTSCVAVGRYFSGRTNRTLIESYS